MTKAGNEVDADMNLNIANLDMILDANSIAGADVHNTANLMHQNVETLQR